MKILFIVTAFNSLSQRAWCELDKMNHQVRVHTVDSEAEMVANVHEYAPDLIIAPYLKSSLPSALWRQYTCMVVHPGIVGDRGSSSLDWAILNNEKEWGVTIIQAGERLDAGTVWASSTFQMRQVSKSALYRHEVTQAAIEALLLAVQRFEAGNYEPVLPGRNATKGRWRRSVTQFDLQFSWCDETSFILKKILAADSNPGVLCNISNCYFYVYGAVEETLLKGRPGKLLAQRDQAVCIATGDGAMWLQCLKRNEDQGIKLPATLALGDLAEDLPEAQVDLISDDAKTFREIRYEEIAHVGYLYFDFYNGAADKHQCRRLHEAFKAATKRDTKVIVLLGGDDLWCNGIHLHVIEAAEDPAKESWENILALDDLIQEIICTESHYVVSALRGNAGGGGVALALAADKIIAQKGIILNPHTRNIGLYGSEYWTYLLPKRIGTERALMFTQQCLPWGTHIAMEVKLIDECFAETGEAFLERVRHLADELASLTYFSKLLEAKKFKRKRDESYKPLQQYREEELEKMHANFFGDDMAYAWKRFCFVHKINPEEKQFIVEKDLFSERRKIWRRRKSDKMFY